MKEKKLTLYSAATCLDYARIMREFAEHITDPGAKSMMLQNAEDWERMAQEREQEKMLNE